MKIAVVISTFHKSVAEKLLVGARRGFIEHAVENFEIFEVPGAFEIPVFCKRLLDTGDYDVLIALGCVIKGQTDHYEHVCRTCSDNIAGLASESGVPIIFEVLMCDSIKLAIERAGGKMGNRGYDAVLYALEMAHALQKMESGK